MAVIRQRKNGNGTVSWQAQIRRAHYKPVSKTFTHKSDAAAWAQDTEREMRLGTYQALAAAPPPPSPSAAASAERPPTVADLVDRFIKEIIPQRERERGNDQRRNFEGPLKEWKAAIGHIEVAKLRATDIAPVKNTMLATKTRHGKLPAPASVLRKLAILSIALKVARNEWDWLDTNPIANVTKPRAGKGRIRYLSDAERVTLLAACKAASPDVLYPFVLVAISTGMRLNEIRSMRWANVDVRDELPIGRVALTKTKNGESRAVSITEPALSEVRRLARLRRPSKSRPLTGYVFPSKLKNGRQPIDIRRPWEEAVEAAGLKDFRFHDLRHTAASHLAMNGATPSEIAEALGHKTLSMVKRYAHLTHSHTAALVARTNAKVFGLEVQP